MSKKIQKKLNSLFKKGKINADKFDAAVKVRIDELELQNRSLKKLGNVTLEGLSSIKIESYDYGTLCPCYICMGKDGDVRSSNHLTTIFFFGKVQLYIYRYAISFISDFREESLTEIYYKDMEGFESLNRNSEIKDKRGKKYILPDKTFKILLGGGPLMFSENWINGETDRGLEELKAAVQAKIFKTF